MGRPAFSFTALLLERYGRVKEVVAGHDVLLHCGGVDYRLEARTGLSDGLSCSVEFAVLKVFSSDERENFTSLRLYADQCSHYALVETLNALPCFFLQFKVKRRVNLHSSAVDFIFAVLWEQIVEE